jgi:Clostripain family
VAKNARWTVMVLMGANNILASEADLRKLAKDDIKEMKKVGSQPDVLNIVVQIDQPEGARRFKITNGQPEFDEPVPDQWQGGLGGPELLEDFLIWTKARCPADHYMLVLWGHAYRLAFNRNPQEPDGLDFPQLAKVLRNTNLRRKKLDIVAFDSCNAGLLEAAYELRETASYFVASQFTDPLPGWPYDTILNRVLNDRGYKNKSGFRYLADADGPKDFGRAIVSQFVRNYQGKDSVTLTMLDLSQVGQVADRVGELSDELIAAVHADDGERSRVKEIFKRCQVPGPTPSGQPSVDLLTLCWNLATFSGSDEVRIAAAAVGDSLLIPGGVGGGVRAGENSFVVAHGRNDLVGSMLQGVSIFAPNVVSDTFDWRSLKATYGRLKFAGETHWDELVFSLAESEY